MKTAPSSSAAPAEADAQAVEFLHSRLTEEEREYFRTHYCTDNGIYVISYACAPAGLPQNGHELHATWGLIGRLIRAVGYYTWQLLVRRPTPG